MRLASHNKNLARFNKEHAAEAPTAEQQAAIKLECEKVLFQITEQEEQCLQTIHCRYCIIKGLPISIGDVNRLVVNMPGKPSYYEYWYKINTTEQAFLMSREIISVNGKHTLFVLFNRELARGDENAADK